MTGATVKGAGATKPRPRPVTRKRQTGSVTRKRQPATKAKTAATPTPQSPAERVTAAVLVGLLEGAWNAIIDRHPEVPDVVVIIGSGTTGRQAKFGHYAPSRWQDGMRRLPEVFISGEGLKRSVTEVFTTLLHEAAHALADVRGIKDTSRQGRWHNKQFAALADELGLDTTKDERLGYSKCTLRPETQAHYQHKLDILQDVLSVYRHPEILTSKTSKSNNALACTCECPRRIRVSRSVLDEGPITCTVCDAYFEPDQA